ncbi:M23 family metallopeptidase [Pseudonocardia alni]|nr:M23 family metallopeptidase [Pseudonocardia alni]
MGGLDPDHRRRRRGGRHRRHRPRGCRLRRPVRDRDVLVRHGGIVVGVEPGRRAPRRRARPAGRRGRRRLADRGPGHHRLAGRPGRRPSAAARTVAVADTGRARAASAVQAATASVDQVRKAAEERARAAEAARAAGATGALQSASAGGAVSIVTGRVTSGFGSRWGTKHMGLDIAAPIGTPIHVPIAGTVISSGPASGFGMWVRVRHADGTVTVYGHINRSLVSVGQKVAAGQQIAEVGNRGQSTGPHLHIEVVDPSGTKINPKPWLDANGFRYT